MTTTTAEPSQSFLAAIERTDGMPVTQQALLDAMDGIAMILDQELCISQIGRPHWQSFLSVNSLGSPAASDCSNERVLGRPVMDFFTGDAVRSTFADLFNRVLGGARPAVQIDYRCNAPEQRRDMRLSVRPIITDGEVRHLLYQSVTLGRQAGDKCVVFREAHTRAGPATSSSRSHSAPLPTVRARVHGIRARVHGIDPSLVCPN